MKQEIEQNENIQIKLTQLVIVTVCLPFFAFLSCVYLSVIYNFDSATSTHCRVLNYLPSISTAIGEFTPQKYIWRFAIALHSAPRFLLAKMYISFLQNIIPSQPIYWKLLRLNIALNIIENIALLGLSFVSSTENYEIHKMFFVTFMICSECYMLLTFLLLKGNVGTLSKPTEKLSLIRKKQLMIVNFLAFFFALYFFKRHNNFCEPFMYSMFAFFEYLVVLSNMGFHMTAFYDFHDYVLFIGKL